MLHFGIIMGVLVTLLASCHAAANPPHPAGVPPQAVFVAATRHYAMEDVIKGLNRLRTWDEHGTLLSEATEDGHNKTVLQYGPNGKIESKAIFKDNRLIQIQVTQSDGSFRPLEQPPATALPAARPLGLPPDALYNNTFRAWEYGPRTAGMKHGRWTLFDARGAETGYLDYKANIIEGDVVLWLPGGRVWYRARYKDNKPLPNAQ